MRTDRKFLNDSRAQAGIGTLIIFIAMVLVAAVAAAVLISTSGILQQKAQKTGSEAIAEVSANVKVLSMVGDRTASKNDYFEYVNITLETAAGAGRIDMKQFKLMMTNGTARVDNITYSTSLPTDTTTFSVTKSRDEDSSFSSTAPVINAGDLVVITVKPSSAISLTARSPYRFEIIPEVGNHIVKEGTTPMSYGVERFINIE